MFGYCKVQYRVVNSSCSSTILSACVNGHFHLKSGGSPLSNSGHFKVEGSPRVSGGDSAAMPGAAGTLLAVVEDSTDAEVVDAAEAADAVADGVAMMNWPMEGWRILENG